MQFYTGQGAYTGVSREQLLTDCRSGLKNEEDAGINMTRRRHACAALIQRDGWRIAPDYPWQYTAREKKEGNLPSSKFSKFSEVQKGGNHSVFPTLQGLSRLTQSSELCQGKLLVNIAIL